MPKKQSNITSALSVELVHVNKYTVILSIILSDLLGNSVDGNNQRSPESNH